MARYSCVLSLDAPPTCSTPAQWKPSEADYYDKRHEDLGWNFLEEVLRVAIVAAKNPAYGSPYGPVKSFNRGQLRIRL